MINANQKINQESQSIPSFQRILYQSGLPMLIKAAGTVATFALSITLARILGISEFGIYSIVVSTVMVLSIPVLSGIPTLSTRETSRALTDANPSEIGFLLRWSNRVIYAYTLVILAAVLLAWVITGQSKFIDGLLVAVITVGTLSITLRNGAVLRGFNQFAKGTAADILIRPLGQLAVLALVLFMIPGIDATANVGLLAFAAASTIAFIFSAFWLRRELSGAGHVWGERRSAPIPWRTSLFFLTVAGGGQVLFGHIDTLILGILGNPEEVGAYRASVQVSMLLIFILTVVNQVLQPSLVKLYLLKDISGMQKLVSDSSFYMFWATLALGAVLIFFASPLLLLTFGSSFIIASMSLQILVIGQLMNVFFGSVGTILNMTGMEKEAVISIAVAITVNIILDIVLIPLFGVVGAASASAVSIFIWNMVSRYYVKTRVGIESSGVIYRMKRIATYISKD